MGAQTTLKIQMDQLESAAGKAGQTLTGSTIPPIPPPPPAAMSQLDAALALVSTQSEVLRTKVDTLDSTWATKQQAALTESPPVLQQQDTTAAGDMERSSEFPTPQVKPPIEPADPTGVQPASFDTSSIPENGPWGLEDGEWELDEWGTPQPVWPDFGGSGGGAGPGSGVSGGVAPI
jgi:hypothetical protein